MESVKEKGANEVSGYARSQVELAATLGVSRRTLCSWRKLEGAPRAFSNGMWPIAEWRRFVHERGLKEAGADVFSGGEDLRARKLLAEIEERELKVAIRKKECVTVREVRSVWTSLVARAVSVLRSKFENELPPVLAGLDAVGIQAACGQAIDEVIGILRDAYASEGLA